MQDDAHKLILDEKKLDLIGLILATDNSQDPSIKRFRKLIEDDFLVFANKQSSFKETNETVKSLENVARKLETLLCFSGVFDKNIVAVGGGFSAGKSQFISSFFKSDSIQLPIDIKPTTAIPTYVAPGKRDSIKGFPEKGGSVNIPAELYQELSHNFVKSFSFNLKDIMPIMALSTQLDYSNICFIDTPGYDPADTEDGYTSTDLNTAKDALQQASVLIWLIGLDANGNIPHTDLNFIRDLDLQDKKLFFVANKAGLKPADQLAEILDQIEETLDAEEIDYAGIAAYDSVQKQEFSYRKISLLAFLKQQDTNKEVHKEIIAELKAIFKNYEDNLKNNAQLGENTESQFKKLKNDIGRLSNEIPFILPSLTESTLGSDSLPSVADLTADLSTEVGYLEEGIAALEASVQGVKKYTVDTEYDSTLSKMEDKRREYMLSLLKEHRLRSSLERKSFSLEPRAEFTLLIDFIEELSVASKSAIVDLKEIVGLLRVEPHSYTPKTGLEEYKDSLKKTIIDFKESIDKGMDLDSLNKMINDFKSSVDSPKDEIIDDKVAMTPFLTPKILEAYFKEGASRLTSRIVLSLHDHTQSLVAQTNYLKKTVTDEGSKSNLGNTLTSMGISPIRKIREQSGYFKDLVYDLKELIYKLELIKSVNTMQEDLEALKERARRELDSHFKHLAQLRSEIIAEVHNVFKVTESIF